MEKENITEPCAKRPKIYNGELSPDNENISSTSKETDGVEISKDMTIQAKNDKVDDEYAATEFELRNNDSNYFRCYADLSIHRVMIGDYSRTNAYRRAIMLNYKLFHQKVVLDVGAGTGILSIFCAQAGAKKVYAIEASGIAKEAEKVVAANDFSNKIIIMQEKIEEVELPEKVDVIVSEWMGYMLMYESMLPSLLYARDKWLKKDGYLFPEEVKIYIAPITDHEGFDYHVNFWNKMDYNYRVKMSVLTETAARQMQAVVHVMSVDPACIQSHASCVTTMKLSTIEASESDCVEGSFKCSCFGKNLIHGFVVWFTVHFPNDHVLSTSPYEKETHWEQSVLYVPPFGVEQDTVVEGQLWIRKGEIYRRFLDVELEYQVGGIGGRKMKYMMKD